MQGEPFDGVDLLVGHELLAGLGIAHAQATGRRGLVVAAAPGLIVRIKRTTIPRWLAHRCRPVVDPFGADGPQISLRRQGSA
jgi:hypothetical protein